MSAHLLALPLAVFLLPSVPGAINPAVTQDDIMTTICVANWTATIRPPAAYTNRLKAQQMAANHLPGAPSDWEEDHRIPLSVGGNPTSPDNLWPEPWLGQWGARRKDRLESYIHRQVCKGKMTLAAGRAIFLGDWRDAYLKQLGAPR